MMDFDFSLQLRFVRFTEPIAIALVFASTGVAQLERFDEKDIPKWALMAHDASNHNEFDLTAAQLDRLLKNEIVNSDIRMRFGPLPKDAPAVFLKEVYEVLGDEQEKRLHQIMFQRWMNRDDMKRGIQAFIPGQAKRLATKVDQLETEIESEMKRVIAALPELREDQTAKLIEFLAWRWEKQTQLLSAELGIEQAEQLIGDAVPQGYTFIVGGDAESSGITDVFGEPYGGGAYYGSGHESRGRSGDIENVSVSFDPVTGKRNQSTMFGSRRKVDDRPVDIPDGWTLADAFDQMQQIESEIAETIDSYAEEIEELQGFRRRFQPGVNRRQAMKDARALEDKLRVEHALRDIELRKVRVIVTRLGGDPDAEQKKVRAASAAFHGFRIACNGQPFISHIDATAEQCDALDKVWDRFGGNSAYDSSQTDSASEEEYYQAVAGVLNENQRKLLNQQRFRQLWYSKNAQAAIDLAGLKLNAEQKQKVALLPKLIREAERLIRTNQSTRHRRRFFSVPEIRGRNESDEMNKPYVVLEEEFTGTLTELFGRKEAADLLGLPMAYDPDWKRPYVVPDGLTLEKAKAEYDRLTAESRRIRMKQDKLMEELMERNGDSVFEPFFGAQSDREEQRHKVQRQRDIQRYRGLVEQLGGKIKQ